MSGKKPDTESLWKAFSGHVRSFVARRVPDRDVDDVLQEIFVRIHEGLSSLDDRRKVQSWIFTIARRSLVDYYRERERKRKKLDDRKEPKPEARPVSESPATLDDYGGEHDVHEEVLSWLVPMIDELPEKYRVPLKMADVNGKTQQEVADALGLSLSGAKSRVQRARAKLGEVLAECCQVEFGEEGRAVSFRRKRDTDRCSDC